MNRFTAFFAAAAATLTLTAPVRTQANPPVENYILCGSPVQEADAKAGFNLGLSVGKKHRLQNDVQPSMDYLDKLVEVSFPHDSDAFKTGYKAGFLAAFQKTPPDPIP